MIILNGYASDLVNIYRIQGLNSVEIEIEKTLKDQDYWKEYLKDKNVDYGYYEYKKYVLLAQKDQSEISLFKIVNNNFELVLRNNVITGENQGDKYTEGDKRTPEGSYDLVEKKIGLDQFYGPFALVTSYPNVFDQSLNKNGSGIWIHGKPFNGERENVTKGCIALDNNELENLERNLDLKKTILITTQNQFKKATKDEMALILATIFKWKDAWKYSQFNEYMSFYSTEFKKADMSGFSDFKEYKERIFTKDEKKTINFTNIDISPYPNSFGKNMFRIFMDEEYLSPAIKFHGNKELFIEIINNEVKILSED
jgi:murein L,D-transpeptidase YafK